MTRAFKPARILCFLLLRFSSPRRSILRSKSVPRLSLRAHLSVYHVQQHNVKPCTYRCMHTATNCEPMVRSIDTDNDLFIVVAALLSGGKQNARRRRRCWWFRFRNQLQTRNLFDFMSTGHSIQSVIDAMWNDRLWTPNPNQQLQNIGFSDRKIKYLHVIWFRWRGAPIGSIQHVVD